MNNKATSPLLSLPLDLEKFHQYTTLSFPFFFQKCNIELDTFRKSQKKGKEPSGPKFRGPKVVRVSLGSHIRAK